MPTYDIRQKRGTINSKRDRLKLVCDVPTIITKEDLVKSEVMASDERRHSNCSHPRRASFLSNYANNLECPILMCSESLKGRYTTYFPSRDMVVVQTKFSLHKTPYYCTWKILYVRKFGEKCFHCSFRFDGYLWRKGQNYTSGRRNLAGNGVLRWFKLIGGRTEEYAHLSKGQSVNAEKIVDPPREYLKVFPEYGDRLYSSAGSQPDWRSNASCRLEAKW